MRNDSSISAINNSPDSELQHFHHRKSDNDHESVGDWSSFLEAEAVDNWRADLALVDSTDKADNVAADIHLERQCVEESQ